MCNTCFLDLYKQYFPWRETAHVTLLRNARGLHRSVMEGRVNRGWEGGREEEHEWVKRGDNSTDVPCGDLLINTSVCGPGSDGRNVRIRTLQEPHCLTRGRS